MRDFDHPGIDVHSHHPATDADHRRDAPGDDARAAGKVEHALAELWRRVLEQHLRERLEDRRAEVVLVRLGGRDFLILHHDVAPFLRTRGSAWCRSMGQSGGESPTGISAMTVNPWRS